MTSVRATPATRKILLVDDEQENLNALGDVIERDGWTCLKAQDATEALRLLRSDSEIGLMITDLKMPHISGLDLLQNARLIRPDVQRVLVTAYGSIEETVEAMRAGAFDVLTKPLKSKTIRELVAKLMEKAPPLSTHSASKTQHISAGYAEVVERVRRAALSRAQVLFLGESGTGKSFLAKQLHQESGQNKGPFVSLNCAAIPHDLLESELFGFERGAFTGATFARDGKIMAAHGGTLLLDEVGDLSLGLQAKLLQFIHEKKFFKLGSNKEIQADVRLLAATNHNLEALVKDGKFREDLLYRLRVVEITVPALRVRKDDLFWLVPALLDQLAEKNSRPAVRLTHDAFKLLYEYNWPGNIRELENVLESAFVMASDDEIRQGLLTELSFPQKLKTTTDKTTLGAWSLPDLATIERQAIQQALTLSGGNRRLAASLLGISERTLYRVLGSQDAPSSATNS